MNNKLRYVLGLFLLLFGLACIFYQDIANFFLTQQVSSYVVHEPKPLDESQKVNAFDSSVISSLKATDAIGQRLDNLPVTGKIVIPSVQMNLPIFYGMTNQNLMVGAGTMSPHQTPGEGNYALAGHSVFYGWSSRHMLFTPLHRAKIGSRLYIFENGYIYTYNITEILHVKPNNDEVLQPNPSKATITLITCTDLEATMRLIVKGTYESKLPYSEASPDVVPYLYR